MKWNVDNLLDNILPGRMGRIGIALSGGGAKGFAHIGVLRAMEEAGIAPDIISGVSAGSIAAVLYGAGLTPDEMFECFASYSSRFSDFVEWTLPREGFLRMDRFAQLLDSWLPVKNLEELKTPVVVCASDMIRGKSIGWVKGEIVPRVIASCSIPVVFSPVKIGDSYYVDGGVLRNLPAWAIRKSCKTLFGSNCSPLNRDFEYTKSLIAIAMRSFQLMTKSNTLIDLSLCDHVIQSPGLAAYNTFNLSQTRDIVKAGYEQASRLIEQLKL